MAASASTLGIGARIKFRDRWRGSVTGFEVAEDWEVVNIFAQTGLLFRTGAKLPFSIATGWSDDHLALDADSAPAFSREVPPVAVPARPISAETPVSIAGTRLAGLIVSRSDRRATEVLLRAGVTGPIHRVRTTDTEFEGKTLKIAVQADRLPVYRPDNVLAAAIREVLAADRLLTAHEKLSLALDVETGGVALRGNVHNHPAKQHLKALVAAVDGVVSLQAELVDDVQLETDLGLALERSGVSHASAVYVRSTLGNVTLFGATASPRAAQDIALTVSRVPGVRRVNNRLQVSAAAAAR